MTHLVDAAGFQEAGIAAINLIKQDSNLYDITLNQENDPPILDVDEIEEANSLDVSTGFGFYPEDESG